ncbi:BnaA02g12200D [Brassica napus]|uniref:BnaA02g12200D protein n=1 Tax=Brassica napus TaxID=3708 RepID=A0A078FTR3_BRANA|nr:BnaA02g12200D [Brassica napus]
MKKSNIKPLLFTLLTFIDVSPGASNVFNVVSFGANPDGVTDSTAAFLKAWQAACGSASSATMMAPTGTFVVKAITFGGPCKSELKFQVAGTVVAPADYREFRNSGYWILFKKVSKFSLVGGTFDARANGFWACRKSGQNCPPGVRVCTSLSLVSFYICILTKLRIDMREKYGLIYIKLS